MMCDEAFQSIQFLPLPVQRHLISRQTVICIQGLHKPTLFEFNFDYFFNSSSSILYYTCIPVKHVTGEQISLAYFGMTLIVKFVLVSTLLRDSISSNN